MSKIIMIIDRIENKTNGGRLFNLRACLFSLLSSNLGRVELYVSTPQAAAPGLPCPRGSPERTFQIRFLVKTKN